MLESGQGPVTAGGTLRNGYLFPLEPDGALELLRKAGSEAASVTADEELRNAARFEGYVGGPSDRLAIVAVRAEQCFLREQQLRRWGSSCSLCGRSLPKELLVAAHIKPRWACSESERMDTRNVSMLACLFGCDALFELGYVVVGEHGIIERGRRGSETVEDQISRIVGLRCLAHGGESRQYFAWHQQRHSAQTRRDYDRAQ